MNKYLKQKAILVGVMVLFYLLVEVMAFLWIGFPILPIRLLIDLMFILLIASVILVIPSNFWSIIYISVWILLVNAVFLTNANLFSAYFELFSLEQFTLIGEATDILNLDYLSLFSFVLFFLLIVIYVLAIRRIFKRYLTDKPRIGFKGYLSSVLVFVVVFFGLATILGQQELSLFEAYAEDEMLPTLKRESLKNYGLLAYYFKEADLLYFNDDDQEIEPVEIPYLESTPSPYFGLLEGYNVFTIMIESGEAYAIHPDLTPNLYMMSQAGLNFTNNYSENKTNVSETIGSIGHYPPIHFVPEDYTYSFETSIPNILADDYETAYFHDNYSMFYSRGDLLDMIGFENLYFHDEIFDNEPRWEWDGNLTLDSVTATRMVDLMFETDDPFYYFWTTLLMHGPYNEGETNIQLFEDLGYFDTIEQAELDGTWVNPLSAYDEVEVGRMKYYQAAMMDFDAALGILMDALDQRGKLDETLFVIYGDHTAYYHKFNHMVLSDDGELRPYYDMELYTSFLCIYNEDLSTAYLNDHSNTQITKFTSPLVIVPTVLDLLGQTYNQNLMLNDNVFTGLEHVFYSNKLTTIFTDQVYSDNGYDIIYQKEDVGDNYIEEFRYQSELIIEKLNWINQYYSTHKEPIPES